MAKEINIDLGEMWRKIQSRLKERGVDIDFPEGIDICCGDERSRVKVVCVQPDLKDSVEEMGKTHRDQVVMVRVDEATLKSLDAWVAIGAVRSRSEAAALFIREGLKVRADELEQLRDALREVEEAQERLKTRAQELFGKADESAADESADPGIGSS